MHNRGPHAAAGQGGDYLPVLDGLRAVSILLVLLAHLGLEHALPGAFGVTLFFFLSGYLITRQLLGGLRLHGKVDFAGFYLRRALRLMPAGLVYILLAGCGFAAAGGRISPAGWFAALFYGANYADLGGLYRSTLGGVRHPFNILWSLAVEEHFYLIWPALLVLLMRTRRAGVAVLALCAAVLAWRFALLDLCFAGGVPLADAPLVCGPANPNPLWTFNRLYLATDARFDSIAWGALLALWEGVPALRASAVRAACGAALLGASFLLTAPLLRFGLRPSLQGGALLWVLPWLLRARPAVLCSAPALLLGRLSYSLYLWHWGALAAADYLAPAHGAAWLALALAGSAALTAASFWGIERPMLRLRRRFGSHAPISITAVP